MSLRNSIKKWLRATRRNADRIKQLEDELARLKLVAKGMQAHRDAMAVPTASTLWGEPVRFFKVTAIDEQDSTATATLLELNSSGNMVDDADDTSKYTLKPNASDPLPAVDDHVAAVFAGIDSLDASYHIIVGGKELPAGAGQYKVLQLDAGNNPHWDWVRATDSTGGV